MTTNSHGCVLAPEGAQRAAETHSMLPALLALAGLQVMTAVIAVVVGRKTAA